MDIAEGSRSAMVISPVHFPFFPRVRRRVSYEEPGETMAYFRRGSGALVAGIMAMARARKKDTVTVWFPDYFCKEPLAAIDQHAVRIVFYPITRELTPNWEVMRTMLDSSTPDAFVLVHYFGFPNDLAGARAFSRDHGIELIEDCAHVMQPSGAVGTSGIFSAWSPWKFFPLPDLGILRTNSTLQPHVHETPRIGGVFFWAQWLAKRAAQRVLLFFGIHWYARPTGTAFSWLVDENSAASRLSIIMFQAYQSACTVIAKRRRNNFQLLDSLLVPRDHGFQRWVLDADVVPYAFPYVTNDQAAIASNQLILRGVPAYPWPDLPDAVKGNTNDFPWANFYMQHLLLLPIHQDITAFSVRYIATEVARRTTPIACHAYDTH